MKRKIIKIDEQKCNGCGLCIPNCPEGALKIINGKAQLVGELLCDGLGECIGNCPEGAITIEESEVQAYNEKEAMKNVIKLGKGAIDVHLKHLRKHKQEEYLEIAIRCLKANNIDVDDSSEASLACGCPGTMEHDFRDDPALESNSACEGTVKSELRQWPTQLQLLSSTASYFQNCELLVAADCVPFAYADFHRRFLKGKTLIMFCPKLDATMDAYLEKLTSIIRDNNIKSVTVVKMEVPCCSATLKLAEAALKKSGKSIPIEVHTISYRGEII